MRAVPDVPGSAMWARVSRVVFAADRHDAAEAGFDDAAFHRRLADGSPALPSAAEPRPDREAPFRAWKSHEGRAPY